MSWLYLLLAAVHAGLESWVENCYGGWITLFGLVFCWFTLMTLCLLVWKCDFKVHCCFRSVGEIFQYEHDRDAKCGDFHNGGRFFKPKQTYGHFDYHLPVGKIPVCCSYTADCKAEKSLCPFPDSWSICLYCSYYHLCVCVIYNHNRTTAWPLDELQYNANPD